MSSDYTQQQTLGELQKAEKLSLQSTVPPAEVPGYRIEKLLGQGAFGQVWLGRDLNTGRQVAVKFYLHRGGVNWSLLSREVKHLVNMSTGRHIVQILGVGWEAEPPYYVMEYLENGSLEDLIRARGALGINESVTLFREIAGGLNFAHGKGVLHCDLKPANVLLDHDWRPRIADFGQSRMSHEQSPSLGTLFYMAPEQSDLNALVDARWDVYALGAILYSMLVGSPPHRSNDTVKKLDTAATLPERLQRYRETILHSPPPQLHYRRRGVDKVICQIVDKCLAPRPENRYSNVEQVLEAIERREVTRLRRPLYVLGIIGPILLSLLMLLFSARSIGVAKEESLQRVHNWSIESNQFAAKFAARTLSSEIDGLFREIQMEAGRDELRSLVSELTQSGQAVLQSIAENSTDAKLREKFIGLEERKKLDEYLHRRIEAMTTRNGVNSAAIFNSLFVTDSRGTNLSTVFSDSDQSVEQNPVGRNFAYRSYFTGSAEDDLISKRSNFTPTRHAHLSSTFRSTSTGKWKVAVSCPVWLEPIDDTEAPTDRAQPIGVLVLTINLGDFNLLVDQTKEAEKNRFAVLVDGRPGTQQGTLLQHPLLSVLDDRFQKTRKVEAVPQIDGGQFTRLRTEGMADYRDPSADFPEGQLFQGRWIAAIEQVALPESVIDKQHTSDLWVLVQERASYVESPVTQLGTRLQREGYLAFCILVLIVVLLWYFVYRVGKTIAARSSDGVGGNSLNYGSTKSTVNS